MRSIHSDSQHANFLVPYSDDVRFEQLKAGGLLQGDELQPRVWQGVREDQLELVRNRLSEWYSMMLREDSSILGSFKRMIVVVGDNLGEVTGNLNNGNAGLAARSTRYQLEIALDARDDVLIRENGRRVVSIAKEGDDIYIRIFDDCGKLVVDCCGPEVASLAEMIQPDGRSGFSSKATQAELLRQVGLIFPNVLPKKEEIEFLMVLPLPSTCRTSSGELAWLNCTLTHELEHVWQFLAGGDTRLEPPWKALAEMCAVYAELEAHPEQESYVEYGYEFLTRLPEGLLTGSSTDERARPYWWFLFIEHLESICPGISRDVWRSGWVSQEELAQRGPWAWIDERLCAASTCLSAEWAQFACHAADLSRSFAMQSIRNRHSRMLPSLHIDLERLQESDLGVFSEQSGRYNVTLDARVLSAHYVRFEPDRHHPWKIEWELSGAMPDAEMRVYAKVAGAGWNELTPDEAEKLKGGVQIDSDRGNVELILAHCLVPDFGMAFARIGNETRSLGPAYLTLVARCVPMSKWTH